MPIHDGVLRFGYPADGGVAAALEAMVVTGRKTATCLPTGEMETSDVGETLSSIGRRIDILDWSDHLRCRIRITASYRASFRVPTSELILGEGYGLDVGAFQRDHVAEPGIIDHPAAGQALPAIPLELREVVELHDRQLATVQEIRDALRIGPALVRQRLRRGRLRLATSIAATASSSDLSRRNSEIAASARSKHLRRCDYCISLLADRPVAFSGPQVPDELDLEIVVVRFLLDGAPQPKDDVTR
jgi:uncharacterized protein YhfF